MTSTERFSISPGGLQPGADPVRRSRTLVRVSALASLGALALLLSGETRAAQKAPISYSVSFEQREHHEVQITALFTELGSRPLELRMSRSSPGRYRLHEFAKNLYGLTARDALGEPLAVEAVTPSSWRIKDHHGTVEVSYTLFGDLLSGTYSAIEARLAVLNPPATFVWAKGFEHRNVEVHFELPLGWEVVSQLPEESVGLVRAPDLQYFFDSPIGLGSFDHRWWRVDRKGRELPAPSADIEAQADEGAPRSAEEVAKEVAKEVEGEQRFRLAINHQGDTRLVDRYQSALAKLVAEATAVFGELPEFDYGTYTVIANYLPDAHDDAMEHRNSTVHSSPDAFSTAQSSLLNTLIHEFFHVWNVERIRPASLEPFDFERLNPSAELWFAEGFTNYYDGLLMTRAGLRSESEFLDDLSTTVDRFLNSPGRRFGGAAYMSLRAAFNDRAAWVDPRNKVNTYLHYYFYGEALALALDLELQQHFDSHLDAFMQKVWERYGRKEKPYSNADLEQVLIGLTNEKFASEFFERFVSNGGTPDFAALLAGAGLALTTPAALMPWLGFAELAVDSSGVFVRGETRFGSPLYDAGLGRGDRIVELGGRKIRSLEDIERELRGKRPGAQVRIVSERRKEWREGVVTLGRDPTVKVVIDQALQSGRWEAQRDAWLSSRVEPLEQGTPVAAGSEG